MLRAAASISSNVCSATDTALAATVSVTGMPRGAQLERDVVVPDAVTGDHLEVGRGRDHRGRHRPVAKRHRIDVGDVVDQVLLGQVGDHCVTDVGSRLEHRDRRRVQRLDDEHPMYHHGRRR